MIDKRVAKKKAVINKIAKRMIPTLRKLDLKRLSGKKVNEEFESMLSLDEQFDLMFEVAHPAMIGRGHWQIEQEIRATGIDWTFLRPGFFMQNFLNMAEPIKGMGKVMMPVPSDVGLGMIDVRDTADATATILTTEGHAGQVYELSGPNVTPAEAVAAIGEAIGKEITFVQVPMEGAIGAMKERGMPDWLVDHQSTLMGIAAAGDMASYGNDQIETLTGYAPRTPADFARDHAGAFQE
jgi:uncharacterized protein YbjT (DUF2867 family)